MSKQVDKVRVKNSNYNRDSQANGAHSSNQEEGRSPTKPQKPAREPDFEFEKPELVSQQTSRNQNVGEGETDIGESYRSHLQFKTTTPKPKNKKDRLKQIKEARKGYKLDEMQFDTPQEFLSQVKYEIDLSQLYEIYDSCNYNDLNQYCPVLVKVKEHLREDYFFQDSSFVGKTAPKFLLQVWSRQGKLVFERHLQDVLEAWNIRGSDFVFQEKGKPHEFYYLFICDETRQDQTVPTTLYKFSIPVDKFIAKKEKELLVADLEDNPNKRQPKVQKVKTTIGMHRRHLLFAGDSCVYFFDLVIAKDQADKAIAEKFDYDKERLQDELFKQVIISSGNLHYFTYQVGDELHSIIDTGDDKTVMFIENRDHHLLFYQIEIDGIQPGEVSRLGLSCNQIFLGNDKQQARQVISEEKKLRSHAADIEQFRFVIKQDQDGNLYNTVLVLRVTGTIEFYADFNLVEIVALNSQCCLDIESDNINYFLEVEHTNDQLQKFIQVVKVPVSWRQQIGLSVSSVEKDEFRHHALYFKKVLQAIPWVNRDEEFKIRESHKEDILKDAIHKRISSHFKLFTQFISYQRYMLVAHGQFITVYDLWDKGNENLKTFKFGAQVVLIALNERGSISVDKSESAKLLKIYNIAVLLGNNEVRYLQEKKNPDRGVIFRQLKTKLEIKERIIQHCFDQINKTAVYFLTEGKPASKDTPIMSHRDFSHEHSGNNRFIVDYKSDQTQPKQIQALHKKELRNLPLPEGFCDILNNECRILTFHVYFEQKAQTHLLISGKRKVDFPRNKSKMVAQDLIYRVSSSEDKLSLRGRIEDEGELEIQNLGGVVLYPQDGEGTLISVVTLPGTKKELGERFQNIARITTTGISLHNPNDENQPIQIFKNPYIRDTLLIDDSYLYCICDDRDKRIQMFNSISIDNAEEVLGADVEPSTSGLFVYDIRRLLRYSELESYFIEPAIGGQASQINFSMFNQRFSFMECFSKIYILPFPNRNTINLLGFGPSSEYLIWREKNGFFTALHRSGDLRTWSISSGKMIHRDMQYAPLDLTQYKIYQAFEGDGDFEEGDTSYTKNFYNNSDSSIQLLIQERPETLNDEQKQSMVQSKNERIFPAQANRVNQKFNHFQVYNFIVLQLITYEDTKNNKKHSKHEAKVLFQFKFAISDIPAERPLLHLSADKKKLMEIIKTQSAFIFKREKHKSDYVDDGSLKFCGARVMDNDSSDEEAVKEYTWIKKHTIAQYPHLLQNTSTIPYLFDPQFRRFIDVDYAEECFVIRNVKEKKDGRNEIEIPTDLLSLTSKITVAGSEKHQKIKSEKSCQLIAKRIHFVEKDLMRIVNKEGIDVLFDLELMKIVAYCKRDNLTQDDQYFEKQRHFILEPTRLDSADVFQRLVRRCQDSKVNLEFQKFYWNRARILGDTSYKRNHINLLRNQFKIDYSQQSDAANSSFLAEFSFTVLDWIILQRIRHSREFKLSTLDKTQQIQLGFNIFPKNQSMLHILAAESRSADSKIERVDFMVQQLFEAFNEGLNESIEKTGFDRDKKQIELPIFEDLNGKTPIDEALGLNDEDDHDSIFYQHDKILSKHYCKRFKKHKRVKKCGWWGNKVFNSVFGYIVDRIQSETYEPQGSFNLQIASLIFSKTKDYSYLHSGSLLSQSVSKAIKCKVPGIGDYLDSRLVKPEHLPFSCQPAIKSVKSYQNREGAYEGDVGVSGKNDEWMATQYGVVEAQIWDRKSFLVKSLFKHNGNEVPMKMYYLDVPSLHLSTKQGLEFIEALYNLTDERDILEIYQHRSVQIIVNEHWAKQRWYFFIFQFLPYLLQLCLFTTWSNFIVGNKASNQLDWVAMPIQRTLVVVCIYFLFFECLQFIQSSRDYLVDFENWIQVIPLVFILINVQKQNNDHIDPQFWHFQMIAALGVWYRFLYCLRSLQVFSYYIRMLFIVIGDMSAYLIILGILVLGFADSIYSLSFALQYESTPTEQFINGYTDALQWSYLGMLGAGATDGFDGYSWWFFVGLSVLQVIVMLNFLVSIIGDTYERIDGNKAQWQYKEIVSLVNDTRIYTQFNILVYDVTSEMYQWVNQRLKKITCCQLKKKIEKTSKNIHKCAKILYWLGFIRMESRLDRVSKETKKISMLGKICGCGKVRDLLLKWDIFEAQNKCELLFFVIQDPENRDSTHENSQVQDAEDSNQVTLNEIQKGLDDLNEKLGDQLNETNETVQRKISALAETLKQEQEQLAALRLQFQKQLLEAEEQAAREIEDVRRKNAKQLEQIRSSRRLPVQKPITDQNQDHNCEFNIEADTRNMTDVKYGQNAKKLAVVSVSDPNVITTEKVTRQTDQFYQSKGAEVRETKVVRETEVPDFQQSDATKKKKSKRSKTRDE